MTPRVGQKGNPKADPAPQNGNPQTSDAPRLSAASGTGTNPTASNGNGPKLTAPATAAEHAMAKLRKHVEENADYVGENFADEARAMHDGSSPQRAIYGEAQPEQARALIDEGIPISPLPLFLIHIRRCRRLPTSSSSWHRSHRKTNNSSQPTKYTSTQ